MRSLLAGFRRIENMTLQARIGEVTERIVERSRPARSRYLDRIEAAAAKAPRKALGCANQAHAFAACGAADKERIYGSDAPNLGIVTAYNDMLSAHQPYERFPGLIREAGFRDVREIYRRRTMFGNLAFVSGSKPQPAQGRPS